MATIRAVRAAVLAAALACAAACRFDPGGVGSGDDGPGDRPDAAAPVDAADPAVDAPAVDASTTSPPADAAPPVDATEPILTCDAPADCPGEACCLYVGFVSSCASSCLGGEVVCETDNDCGGFASSCCPAGQGLRACRAFCL